MDDEKKWKAVISNNSQYDGVFYYAVKTTGIFCRPSCKARAPLRENTVFFNSIEEATNAHFRPCKMCRPDLKELHEPNKQVIEKLRLILEENTDNQLKLKDLASKLGFSESHLSRLFKNDHGVTPNEYLTKIKVEKAKHLLSKTKASISDIAYEAGFGSMSNFYKYFKEHTGLTPKQYRKE